MHRISTIDSAAFIGLHANVPDARVSDISLDHGDDDMGWALRGIAPSYQYAMTKAVYGVPLILLETVN